MSNQALVKELGEVESAAKIAQMIGELDITELEQLYDFLETRRIIRAQDVPIGEEAQFIRTMIKTYDEKDDKVMLGIDLYNYGRIQGIRAERARRMERSKEDKLIRAIQQGHEAMKKNGSAEDTFIQGFKDGLRIRTQKVV